MQLARLSFVPLSSPSFLISRGAPVGGGIGHQRRGCTSSDAFLDVWCSRSSVSCLVWASSFGSWPAWLVAIWGVAPSAGRCLIGVMCRPHDPWSAPAGPAISPCSFSGPHVVSPTPLHLPRCSVPQPSLVPRARGSTSACGAMDALLEPSGGCPLRGLGGVSRCDGMWRDISYLTCASRSESCPTSLFAAWGVPPCSGRWGVRASLAWASRTS